MTIKTLFLLLLLTNIAPNYSSAMQNSRESSQNTCSICIEEVNEGDNITLSSCSHSFCRACIADWTNPQPGSNRQPKNTCPNCRAQITAADRAKIVRTNNIQQDSQSWRDRLKLKWSRLWSASSTYVRRNPLNVVRGMICTAIVSICAYLNIRRASRSRNL